MYINKLALFLMFFFICSLFSIIIVLLAGIKQYLDAFYGGILYDIMQKKFNEFEIDIKDVESLSFKRKEDQGEQQ